MEVFIFINCMETYSRNTYSLQLIHVLVMLMSNWINTVGHIDIVGHISILCHMSIVGCLGPASGIAPLYRCYSMQIFGVFGVFFR